MSGKLDQSLDTIVAARRKNSRPLRRTRRVGAGTKPPVAPIGGVKKATRTAKKNDKASAAATTTKESKIMVSNLPADVSEQQIKDYFQQTVAAVKKVLLVYGPNGQSRGIASVVFFNGASAAKAVAELNGVKVDNKPMKVEVIVDGKDAPQPAEKKLADRITQRKSAAAKPKPATDTKNKAGTGGRVRGTGRRGRGGTRAAGRVKKTAEELDAEMVDYFHAPDGSVGASNGAALPANGDTNMDDDVM